MIKGPTYMGIKHNFNKEFFKKWSPDMAYLLGYIYADGTLINCDYIRARYMSIASVDKDALEKMQKLLDSEHKITSHKSKYLKRKTIFKFKIGSHELYNDLVKLGLYPNKSLTIRFPNVPNEFLGPFIRGYFDGDGCIYFEKRKSYTGKIIIKRIRVIFTSGSQKFFENMNSVLARLGIEKGKIYKSKRSFQLIFNNKDSIKLYKLMYKDTGNKAFFMRKFKIFNDYFALRQINIDKEVRDIIDSNT